MFVSRTLSGFDSFCLQVSANTSCLAITFSLSELVNHLDLGALPGRLCDQMQAAGASYLNPFWPFPGPCEGYMDNACCA